MSAKRNRSRSGASVECPECRKKLRGEKGLAAHRKQEHGEEKRTPAPHEMRLLAAQVHTRGQRS